MVQKLKFIFVFIGILVSSSFVAKAQSQVLDDSRLRFDFVSHDGQTLIPCRHQRIRDLPDWQVQCKGPNGLTKTYAAHVVLTRGVRPPQLGQGIWYEILYWVTDRKNNQKPVFHSSSMTLNLSPSSQLQSFRIYQGVENDFGSLVLTVLL